MQISIVTLVLLASHGDNEAKTVLALKLQSENTFSKMGIKVINPRICCRYTRERGPILYLDSTPYMIGIMDNILGSLLNEHSASSSVTSR